MIRKLVQTALPLKTRVMRLLAQIELQYPPIAPGPQVRRFSRIVIRLGRKRDEYQPLTRSEFSHEPKRVVDMTMDWFFEKEFLYTTNGSEDILGAVMFITLSIDRRMSRGL